MFSDAANVQDLGGGVKPGVAGRGAETCREVDDHAHALGTAPLSECAKRPRLLSWSAAHGDSTAISKLRA